MDPATSESELLRLAIGGDALALAALLERNGPIVRARLAADMPRKWQSVLSIDDVLQQAYTDAFLAISRFVPHGEGAFLAWLTRLARNAMLDALDMLHAQKRGGNRNKVEPDTDRSLTGLLDAVKAVSATPSREVANRESLEALRRCIERLPQAYRQVVELYDLQQCSIEETAASLGRTVGAAYMLRSRAHHMLAELLMGDNSQSA